jgi:hypothetical protein
MIDPTNDTLSLYLRENGNSTLLQETDVTVNEGTEYRLVLQLKPTVVSGLLRDTIGTDIAGAADHDRTFYDGYLGVYLDGGAPCYFDLLKIRPRIGFAHTFEDGDLSQYTGETSAYTIQSSTVLVGTKTLKAKNTYSAIAHETKTRRGNGYKCTVQAGSGSESRPGLLACVQDPTSPMENCYWVQANPEYNTLSLFQRDAGSTTVLDQVDITIEKGKTYQLALQLRDAELKASLYTEYGIELAATSVVSDTSYTSGRLGIQTGGPSAPAYYDNLIGVPLTNWGKHTVNAPQTEAEKALQDPFTEEVLNELGNPSTSPADATRENVYVKDKHLEMTHHKIPMEHGELQVTDRGGQVEMVEAFLDRSTMSDSQIDDLSGDFGWPSSEEASVVNQIYDNKVHFMRSTTDSEQNDVKNQIEQHDGRTDEPAQVTVMNNDSGGNYRSINHDKAYDVNHNTDTVTHEKNRSTPRKNVVKHVRVAIGL